MEALMRIMSRFGITEKDVERMNEAVGEALGAGPMTQRELSELILPRAGKKVRAWMKRVWSPFRPALVEGLICYGPDRGQEVAFVRVDQWLPRQGGITEEEAKQILFRRYLSAYGPATLQDFSKWSGIPAKEVSAVRGFMQEEIVEVSYDKREGWILRDDYDELAESSLEDTTLRLLPGFDPYMLVLCFLNNLNKS